MRKINQVELSEIIGITVQQIIKLEKDGVFNRNGEKFYTLPNAVSEYITYKVKSELRKKQGGDDVDINEANRRKAIAQATLLEMEVAEKEGKLISIEEIRKENEYILTSFRNKTLGVPSRISPALLGLETIAEIKSILDDAMYELLTELSQLEDM